MQKLSFLIAATLLAGISFLVAEPAIQEVQLVQSETGKVLRTLTDGDTIEGKPFTIVAQTNEDAASVVFQLTGKVERSKTESQAPFSLGGDSNGKYGAVALPEGNYQLTATPHAEAGGQGAAGPSTTIKFKVNRQGATVAKTDKHSPPAKPAPAREKIEVGELKKVELKNPVVSGANQQFQKTTITFEGPDAAEDGKTNPFRDYRLEVQFIHESEGIQIVIPGHYAADGKAAESSAKSGKLWRVHFTPEISGDWRYWVWFRGGKNAALSEERPGVNDFEAPAGEFKVAAFDEAAPGFASRGVLRHLAGERYLTFSGPGEAYLKGGADSPENFLGYVDFDGTWKTDKEGKKVGPAPHRYEPHVRDWQEGDPTWKDGKGKGIIGALNYLASEGMNSVYFIPYNLDGGDGKDTWPWINPDSRDRFDVSKLDQWGIVLDHMDTLGLAKHIILQETENDQGLDKGSLGDERMLYFRELVSRFGHSPALFWNLGEENTNTTEQQKAYCEYLERIDAMDHPVVLHTFPGKWEQVYKPLLGFKGLNGLSLQMGKQNDLTHAMTLDWIQRSAEAGHQWFVCHDETGPANRGLDPDSRTKDSNHAQLRTEVLWGNLMAGGAGVEWYFGYQNPHNDLNAEDWRSRDRAWDYTRHALTFFQTHLPFTDMENSNDLLVDRGDGDYVYSQADMVYAVYLQHGREVTLDLSNASGTWTIGWFDPRDGGALLTGSAETVTGGSTVSLGSPPQDSTDDWAVLLKPAH